MTKQMRVLFGIPVRHHVEIAMDELTGLQNLGFACERFPYAAKEGDTGKVTKLFRILQNSFKLIFKAYSFKPDIVYINSRFEAIGSTRDFITIFVFRLFYYKKVHFAVKSHGSDLEILQSSNFFISKVVLPFLRRNVTAWFFLSNDEKDIVNKSGFFAKNKIFVTKNVVRISQFEKDITFRKDLNIADDYKILLFVGRLILEKGIHQVIDSFVKIQKKHKTVLIIVGDGDELEAIKEKVTKYNLADRVILTEEFIPEPQTVRYYSNSDILVFPTYASEGFPMALFNSVASGLSIVTTPIRAAKDYLTEPENCLWVEEQNSESVFKALDKLLSNEIDMNKIRTNNKRKAEIFSREYISKDLSKMLKNIMLDVSN